VWLLLQGVHNQWSQPTAFQPERFMPGGEYDHFEENVRPYMFVPFIQVRFFMVFARYNHHADQDVGATPI
jgi:hypothetical protein